MIAFAVSPQRTRRPFTCASSVFSAVAFFTFRRRPESCLFETGQLRIEFLYMRVCTTVSSFACAVLIGAGSSQAQSLLAKPTAQHATIAASASAPGAAAGSVVTLWADVTPNPSIHIYAEGAKDFTPVSLALTPNAAVTPGKAKFPKADVATAPGATEAVPAYTQPFRIALPVTIKATAKTGDVITVAGAVSYQGCDDRLCYPVSVAPVVWKIAVK